MSFNIFDQNSKAYFHKVLRKIIYIFPKKIYTSVIPIEFRTNFE